MLRLRTFAVSAGLLVTLFCLSTKASGSSGIYGVEAILPATDCTSVDLSPDETRLALRHAFVGPYDIGYLEYDAATYAPLSECHVSGTPWAGRYASDGGTVWTSRYYGGYVTEVDLATEEFYCNLDVGSWTDDLIFCGGRRYLLAAENDPGTGAVGSIQVVDTWNCQNVTGILLNGEPGRFARAIGDDYIYVATRNVGTERLYQIECGSWVITGSLDLPGIGDAGISVYPDGSRVYVPDRSASVVRVVDTDSMTEVDALPVTGDAGAEWGFYVEPQGRYAILASGGNVIRIFSIVTEAVVQELVADEGYAPTKFRPVWTADGSKAFVPLPGEGPGVAVLSRRSEECPQLILPSAATPLTYTGENSVSTMHVLFTEPVEFDGLADVQITNRSGFVVPCTVDGSGTALMTINFDVPMFGDIYTIVLADTIISVATGNNFDGDGDGSPGGSATIETEHRKTGDIDGDGWVTFDDIQPFIGLLDGI